jgi:hypothetical protein
VTSPAIPSSSEVLLGSASPLVSDPVKASAVVVRDVSPAVVSPAILSSSEVLPGYASPPLSDLAKAASPPPLKLYNSTTGPCSSDTISDTIAVEFGLTKSQKWQIEWMKEKVKYSEELQDEDRLVLLKNMEEDFRWENRVAREKGLLEDDEEENRKVAWLNEVKEDLSITVVWHGTKGKTITL